MSVYGYPWHVIIHSILRTHHCCVRRPPAMLIQYSLCWHSYQYFLSYPGYYYYLELSGKKKIYTITSICNLLVFRIPALYMERKKKKKHRINNVAAAPVPPWTDLFWLDYWVNWGPLPTKSQLTFRALSQFIHIPCVIEERHNPICVSQYPAPVFSIAAYNSLIHLNFCLM